MLDQIDLNRKIDKEVYKSAVTSLCAKLAELQRSVREERVSVLVLLEGWDTAGKGTLLGRILRPLDPRGFKVYNVGKPSEEEIMRPYLWPFWSKTPAKGQIVFMNRSWYRRFLEGRFDKLLPESEVSEAFDETRNFERQLYLSGTKLVKFFIHLSKKEQKRRLEGLGKSSASAWRVSETEWARHKHYDDIFALTEEMLHATDTGTSPWAVVNGHDERSAEVYMLSTMVKAMEESIMENRDELLFYKKKFLQNNASHAERNSPSEAQSAKSGDLPMVDLHINSLDNIDLSLSVPKSKYKKELPKLQERLREIQYTLYRERIPAVVAFEGWDAAGKGGAIKRLTERLDPRGYEVMPIASPSAVELAHYHLWRFWSVFPKAGHITVFDRTWYGRVLVERIEGFCHSEEWKRAYSEINDMEAQWRRYGAILVKFWMHIDQDEQLRRFESRKNDPERQWKITDEDWRNREKWPLYQDAVEEMLLRTNPPQAPWTVVEANNKEHARIKVLKTVIDAALSVFKARGVKI
ncbi:polyphosphate:AMP phosphotransferase [Synergistales bacterium]|nr:polyphosphate:AMP phosphotransferase [Synergistales bacterium]